MDHFRQYTNSGQTEEVCLSSEEGFVNELGLYLNPSYTFLIILISLFFFCHESVSAQRKGDIGLYGGTSYYMGDINPNMHFYSPGLAGGLLYRYNFHPRTSIRLSGKIHSLAGNDLDFGNDIQQARGASFQSQFLDFAATWEFNFLPYQTADWKKKYSPYVSAGLGYHLVLTSDTDAHNHFSVPFGLGFKFNVSRRMSAGLEYSFRKTFTDKIDGVVNYGSQDKKLLLGNKDWYNFAGVFISYKIFNYREDCPVYD